MNLQEAVDNAYQEGRDAYYKKNGEWINWLRSES